MKENIFFSVVIGESYLAILKITGQYSSTQAYFFNSGLWLAEK